MLFSSWLRNGKRSAPAARRRTQTSPRRRASFRPRLEVLEDRMVPSGYQQLNLVGYEAGMAHHTDPNLNGWGMTAMPNGDFVVANAFSTGLATFYDSSGHVLPQTITVPGSAKGSAALGLGSGGHPTGVVYNPTSDFVISENGKSAPATLIFDSIDGTISGWNPCVDPTHAILIPGRDSFATDTPSVYTGLDIAQNSKGQTVLYAADFLNNRVEMIDGNFNTIGYFTDPTATSIDPNLSVWSVQAQSGKLFVTWADLTNFSGGVVDEYDFDGNLLTPNHFAANAPGQGPLQNPWGITQAPANFGKYSNDILIGNVAGAGNINVFDPNTGAYLGQLLQPNGSPIAIKGVWDLEFGNGVPDSGKTNWLYFDAGPNHPGDSSGGLFGVIKAAGDQGNQLGPQVQSSLVSTSIMSSPTMPTSTMLSPNGMTPAAQDADGNLAAGYPGTVHVSSADSTATLPANSSVTASNVGTHTFVSTMILVKKGKQSLAGSDTDSSALAATDSISVV